MGESVNALISVVHTHTHSSVPCEFVNFHRLHRTVVTLEDHLEGARLFNHEVSGLVLVPMGVSADDDWLFPSGDEARDVADDDRFPEDSASEDVPDGSIGALPHLLELEFFDTGLIGSDGGALDANFALLDGFGSFDGDFVIGGVSVFNAQVEVLDLEVKEGV